MALSSSLLMCCVFLHHQPVEVVLKPFRAAPHPEREALVSSTMLHEVSTVRLRNSLAWLRWSEDFLELMLQLSPLRVFRTTTHCWITGLKLGAMTIKSSMYTMQHMPFFIRAIVVACTRQVKTHSNAFSLKGKNLKT